MRKEQGEIRSYSALDLPDDEGAAWITLFSLRAALPEGSADPLAYRLDGQAAWLSRAEMAARLKVAPKPTSCVAQLVDGAMVTQCTTLAEPSRNAQARFAEATARLFAEHGVRRVLFVGRDEALVCEAGAVLARERDYHLSLDKSGDAAASCLKHRPELRGLVALHDVDFVYDIDPTPFDPHLWSSPPR